MVPTPLAFPPENAKMLFCLCLVTNSITNVTQFVWQDVLFFFLTHAAPAGHDSVDSHRRLVTSLPALALQPLDGWLSPSCSLPAHPPLPGKSIFHFLFGSILISPESP